MHLEVKVVRLNLLITISKGKNSLTIWIDQRLISDGVLYSGAVSQRTIANTQHDMFCPGISSLPDGRIIISGGSDADDTTFFDPSTNAFVKGPALKTPRGYQTSTTLSDGRVFTIGGAYSGPRQSKDGEIFNPTTNTWTALPGAKVAPMLTIDAEGVWRTDNHGWLVSWKNGS